MRVASGDGQWRETRLFKAQLRQASASISVGVREMWIPMAATNVRHIRCVSWPPQREIPVACAADKTKVSMDVRRFLSRSAMR